MNSVTLIPTPVLLHFGSAPKSIVVNLGMIVFQTICGVCLIRELRLVHSYLISLRFENYNHQFWFGISVLMTNRPSWLKTRKFVYGMHPSAPML